MNKKPLNFQDAVKTSVRWRVVRYLLLALCRRLVLQDHTHKDNIIEYYRVMREAAREEFNEDTGASLDAFLLECCNEANQPKP